MTFSHFKARVSDFTEKCLAVTVRWLVFTPPRAVTTENPAQALSVALTCSGRADCCPQAVCSKCNKTSSQKVPLHAFFSN